MALLGFSPLSFWYSRFPVRYSFFHRFLKWAKRLSRYLSHLASVFTGAVTTGNWSNSGRPAQFWIIKGRQAVKDVLSKCVTCKKMLGRAFSTPPTPPLPSFRVSDELAFSKVGVDFAGSLFVKNIYQSKGEVQKRYIALCTCVSTRAIHLELTPDLSATSFSRVLRRFFGRRGLPTLFISDSGKTFKDAEGKKFVLNRNIDWKFNVPTASLLGGFFENCVKLVRRRLKKVLENAKLSYKQLESVLIETEGLSYQKPLLRLLILLFGFQ